MHYLQFRKYFGSFQLVYFVSKVVSSSICLNCQLKLSYNFFVYGYLHSYITDWYFVGKPAFNLCYSETFLLVIFDESFDLVDSQKNIVDIYEDALSPNHVADLKCDCFFRAQKTINFAFVEVIFTAESLLNCAFYLPLYSFVFAKKTLFLDTNHCFVVGTVRVQLQTNFCIDC